MPIALALATLIGACGGVQRDDWTPPPDDAIYHAGRAVVRAVNTAGREAAIDDREAEALLQDGYALLESGDRRAAAERFELLARARPFHFTYRPGHAEALWLGRNDIHGALHTLNRCVELHDMAVPCLAWRARVRAELGDEVGAREDYERVLSYRHEDVDARERFARFLMATDDPARAVEVFDEAIVLEPSRFSLYLSRAQALERAGDIVRARAAFEEVRGLHMDAVRGANHLLRFYERNGFEREARRVQRDIERELERRSPARRLRPL